MMCNKRGNSQFMIIPVNFRKGEVQGALKQKDSLEGGGSPLRGNVLRLKDEPDKEEWVQCMLVNVKKPALKKRKGGKKSPDL